MLEILHFLLGDLWRFLGALVIVALVFDGLIGLVVALRGGRPRSLLGRIGMSSSPDDPPSS